MATAQKYWFRPKRHGYGAEPSNWKGWLATGAYVVLVLGIVIDRLVLPATGGQSPADANAVFWIAVLVVVTAAFVGLCWAKTDGEWRWRWRERG